MAVKPTYEELERRVKEVEKEILENRRLKEESEASKKYLNTILNSSPIGVGISRVTDGKILFTNKRIAEMRGRPESEIVGSSAIDAWVDPEQRKKLVAIFEQKGRVPNKEIHLKRPDGSTYWCLTTWESIRYGGEKCILYWNFDISTIKQAEETLLKNRDELEKKVRRRTQELQQEIKERKEAEMSVRTNEKKYRTLIDNASEAIMVAQDGVFKFANPKGEALFGYSKEELSSRHLTDFIYADDKEMVRVRHEKRLKGETLPKIYPFRIIDKDGRIKWVELSVELFDWEGKPATLCFMTNITYRKQAEEELRKSEEKYRTILGGIEEGYYEVDMAGNFTFTNESFCRITGVSEHELIGLNYKQLTDSSAAETIYALFNEVYTTQKPVKGFYWDLVRKDGMLRHTELSISLITDLEGHREGFRGVARDITERKALEEHLREAHKRDAISTLAGGIAHEFNNALMNVVGNIELLEMDSTKNEPIEEYTESMKMSCNRMSRLTRQLLAYTRGGKYQVQTVIISNFVEDTLSILKSNIDPSIRVETELPGGIFDIHADPTQMQMVFSAVLNNSADAIEKEGRIRIIAGNQEVDKAFAKSHPDLNPGPHVCLKFVDDGRGMDKETIDRIFEPFFSTKFMGRGLGMAAVYGIIENHSGWIGIESEADKGTSVTIYLPAAEVEVENSQ